MILEEELVALRHLIYMRYVFRHLRNLIGFVGVGFIVSVLSLQSYPFQNHHWLGVTSVVALIALGNPYVLRNFGNVTAYLATFSNVAPSEIAAARAVLGEIDITGHLPVTIPGQAAYGEGIQLKATRALPANSALQ